MSATRCQGNSQRKTTARARVSLVRKSSGRRSCTAPHVDTISLSPGDRRSSRMVNHECCRWPEHNASTIQLYFITSAWFSQLLCSLLTPFLLRSPSNTGALASSFSFGADSPIRNRCVYVEPESISESDSQCRIAIVLYVLLRRNLLSKRCNRPLNDCETGVYQLSDGCSSEDLANGLVRLGC